MKDRIRQLEVQISDLKSRFPAHSLQPNMVQELEELEVELESLNTSRNRVSHKFNPQQMAKLDSPQRYKLLPPEAVLSEINLEQGIRLADIGCGIGYFTFPLARALGEKGVVFGLDISPDMLLEARKRYESFKNTEMAFVEFLRSEETKLPFLPDSLDVVFVANVLHEIDNKQEFLTEVARVLKLSGRVVIVEWVKEVMDVGPPMDERLGEDEVKSYLKSSGFDPLTIKHVGRGHFMTIALKALVS